MSTKPTLPNATANAHAATLAVTAPAMPEDGVKALQDIAEGLSTVLLEIPDRIHKAALRDALQTILDVAIENDFRGRYHLFTEFGAEEEEGTA